MIGSTKSQIFLSQIDTLELPRMEIVGKPSAVISDTNAHSVQINGASMAI